MDEIKGRQYDFLFFDGLELTTNEDSSKITEAAFKHIDNDDNTSYIDFTLGDNIAKLGLNPKLKPMSSRVVFVNTANIENMNQNYLCYEILYSLVNEVVGSFADCIKYIIPKDATRPDMEIIKYQPIVQRRFRIEVAKIMLVTSSKSIEQVYEIVSQKLLKYVKIYYEKFNKSSENKAKFAGYSKKYSKVMGNKFSDDNLRIFDSYPELFESKRINYGDKLRALHKIQGNIFGSITIEIEFVSSSKMKIMLSSNAGKHDKLEIFISRFLAANELVSFIDNPDRFVKTNSAKKQYSSADNKEESKPKDIILQEIIDATTETRLTEIIDKEFDANLNTFLEKILNYSFHTDPSKKQSSSTSASLDKSTLNPSKNQDISGNGLIALDEEEDDCTLYDEGGDMCINVMNFPYFVYLFLDIFNSEYYNEVSFVARKDQLGKDFFGTPTSKDFSKNRCSTKSEDDDDDGDSDEKDDDNDDDDSDKDLKVAHEPTIEEVFPNEDQGKFFYKKFARRSSGAHRLLMRQNYYLAGCCYTANDGDGYLFAIKFYNYANIFFNAVHVVINCEFFGMEFILPYSTPKHMTATIVALKAEIIKHTNIYIYQEEKDMLGLVEEGPNGKEIPPEQVIKIMDDKLKTFEFLAEITCDLIPQKDPMSESGELIYTLYYKKDFDKQQECPPKDCLTNKSLGEKCASVKDLIKSPTIIVVKSTIGEKPD